VGERLQPARQDLEQYLRRSVRQHHDGDTMISPIKAPGRERSLLRLGLSTSLLAVFAIGAASPKGGLVSEAPARGIRRAFGGWVLAKQNGYDVAMWPSAPWSAASRSMPAQLWACSACRPVIGPFMPPTGFGVGEACDLHLSD
jgi:hypothetical protein